MQHLLKLFLSPIVFAIGLLWPLVAQVLLATDFMQPGLQVWLLSGCLVLPFALMAQLRGSWIWIK